MWDSVPASPALKTLESGFFTTAGVSQGDVQVDAKGKPKLFFLTHFSGSTDEAAKVNRVTCKNIMKPVLASNCELRLANQLLASPGCCQQVMCDADSPPK